MESALYGQIKLFETNLGVVLAASKADAIRAATAKFGAEAKWAHGPKFTVSTRGEPKGNRKHPEVFYAGTRQAVRSLNAKYA